MAKNVPGFGPQSSVVGKYNSSDNSKTNPLADSQLMSKDTTRSTNKEWEAFCIGRTQNDKPRPQVQSHGHGSKEG
jgi:hypothetical protein